MPRRSPSSLILAGLLLLPSAALLAQVPTVAPGVGSNFSLKSATAAQHVAIAQFENAFVDQETAVSQARANLTFAVYSDPANTANIREKAAAVQAAEQALVEARAAAFAKIQGSPEKLNKEQAGVLVWQAVRPEGGRRRTIGGAGGGRGRGGPPAAGQAANTGDGFASLNVGRGMGGNQGPVVVSLSDIQQTEITRLNEIPAVRDAIRGVMDAKRTVYVHLFQGSGDAAGLTQGIAAWGAAETKLAEVRAAEFAKFQASSPYRLNSDQVQTLASGMTGGRGGL
ncbi:MAG TPA: hypothetical protein VGD88_06905 [Opitutaceae bacterium]